MWRRQLSAGIQSIPVGDFSFYDQVLDAAVLVGALPARYRELGEPTDFPAYFAAARGVAGEGGLAPLEMTKWFDTNYHHLVPELGPDTEFHLSAAGVLDAAATSITNSHRWSDWRRPHPTPNCAAGPGRIVTADDRRRARSGS